MGVAEDKLSGSFEVQVDDVLSVEGKSEVSQRVERIVEFVDEFRTVTDVFVQLDSVDDATNSLGLTFDVTVTLFLSSSSAASDMKRITVNLSSTVILDPHQTVPKEGTV